MDKLVPIASFCWKPQRANKNVAMIHVPFDVPITVYGCWS